MNNLPLSILDSNELYTGSKRIRAALSSSLSDDDYVVSLCKKLENGTSDMEKAMGKALSSVFTPVIFDKDMVRDHSFIGLRDYVNSFVHSKDPEKALAAVKLSGIIQTIGNGIYKLGYLDETAKLNSLLTALKTPEATQALETISATEWFTNLETDQKDFELAFQSKVDTESAINYPLLKESKGTISKTLKALLNYVEANAGLDGAKFSPVVEMLNEIITDVVSISRARITRVANEKKKALESKVG